MATTTVLNPVGFPPAVRRQTPAPRLDGLDGTTLYLVDCRFDDSDVFLGQVQASLSDLYTTEDQLRYMMGLASTDGRLIRPADEPTTARVQFDWSEIASVIPFEGNVEALVLGTTAVICEIQRFFD